MTNSDRDDTVRADFPGGHPDESALDRWRTGELEGEERARMAAHMESCEECRRALAELESFAAAVARAYAADRELASAEEPDWARVQARIPEATAAGSPGREAPPRRSAWARWAPQAAAAVVALVVVGVLWREGVRGPEDARQIAEPEASSVGERAAAADADEPSSFEPESDVVAHGPPVVGQETEALGRTRAAELEGADNRRDGAEFRGDAAAEEALADRVAPSRDADAPQEGARAAAEAPADQNAQDLEREERANAKAAPPAAQNEAAEAAQGLGRFGVEGIDVDVDPHDRFASQARSALAAGDTLSARRTLSLWRDSLAPRDELDAALRRQAEALADSLAALLSALPN